MNPAPLVAVVIPTFRHSVFVAEAIQSVLSQRCPFPILTVIVDDGCPYFETRLAGISHAVACDSVIYLAKPNGGLSSARNAGIDYVLAMLPSVQAVYFLDADNRIGPATIRSSLELLNPDAGIGWVYPDIDRFGIEGASNFGGSYSRLLHIAFENICEAGSLVARAVLERGARFDEAMKSGCEDWDFWLQCLELGFTGRHNPGAGFEYRRRGESMISHTIRDFPRVREYLRNRHPRLHSFPYLLEAEHAEAPRYLAFTPGTDSALAFSDPAKPMRSLPLGEVVGLLHAGQLEPDNAGVPEQLLWAHREFFQLLSAFRLVWSVLNVISARQAEQDLLAVQLEHDDHEIGLCFERHAPPERAVHALAASRSLLTRGASGDESAPASGNEADRPLTIGLMRLKGPFGSDAIERLGFSPMAAIAPVLAALAQHEPVSASSRRWTWRAQHFPSFEQRSRLIERFLGMDQAMPRIPDSSRLHIALSMSSGHTDRQRETGSELARTLRRAGCHVHLFLFGDPTLSIRPEEKLHFASINFFSETGYAEGEAEQVFLGQNIALERESGAMMRKILGFLAGMDAVLNIGVGPLDALAGAIRARGMRFVTFLEPETAASLLGRPLGSAYSALAFEHALDAMFVSTADLAGRLHALGVPREKLFAMEQGDARGEDSQADVLGKLLRSWFPEKCG